MKRYIALLMIVSFWMLISSCYKKFDPHSYMPALTIGGYTSASEVGASHLVAYWAFNGNLIDSVSGTSGTGTNVAFAGGVKGQAVKIGNANSYVLFPADPRLASLQSFTLTFWVNAQQNTTGTGGILSLSDTTNFWGNLDVFFENGSTPNYGLLKIHVFNNGADAWLGNYQINNLWGVWTNIAISYDAASSTFKVFVNGNKITTQTVSNYGPIHFVDAGPLVFGTSQFNTTPSLTSATGSQPWASFLNGLLDEVRVYDQALSENDINALVRLEGRGK
ncbi:concanavalin A-like lectin/glucanase superfamily protein [Thermoflavifilum aggregans]|uniref:Concanavalin A-like lectin/glucanase superfamily protein n=1 Tax=Thermoflavifilum aggregans TaxID=454188 RepID=A0A2M9CRK0_9BACT|nr:LamG domain-containing protein [Thermoflavifilum aggregans]MBX6379360.1 LamG domain-containing protein [Thermoflavifilum aggregans]PJJ74465.1 concanavalin A-like lectin/glucanase superfamily protein [Thermoflavifilum aggregans]